MMLCMPALLFPHMLPRLHAFDPQSTAHCTSSHNGQTRASASPRTGRPLWVSSRRIPISVEAVSTSSEVKTERPRVWCTQHLSKSSGLPHISTHTSDHNIDATRSTSTGRRDYVPSSRSIPAPAGRHRSAAGKRAHRGRGRRQAPAAPRSEPHRATSIRPEPLPGQRHSLPTPSRG